MTKRFWSAIFAFSVISFSSGTAIALAEEPSTSTPAASTTQSAAAESSADPSPPATSEQPVPQEAVESAAPTSTSAPADDTATTESTLPPASAPADLPESAEADPGTDDGARVGPAAVPPSAAETADDDAQVEPAVAAAIAPCTPGPVTDPIAITTTTSPGDGTVEAWERIRFDFSGSISDGHCAGDSFTITLPAQLAIAGGSSWSMLTPDGSATVATMTVMGNQVVVTLTDYVESHTDVSLQGWLTARIDSTVEQGETVILEWDVEGKTVEVPVTVGECPDCSKLPTTAAKWGTYSPDSQTITVTIQLPTATSDEQTFTFTDTLTSAGQEFVCPVTGLLRTYTTVDQWGTPTDEANAPSAALSITSCDAGAVSGTATIAETGHAGRLYLPITVTDASLGEWSDTAQVVGGGTTQAVTATVRVYDGGGQGSGIVPEEEQPTPTPQPTVPNEQPTPQPTVPAAPPAPTTVAAVPAASSPTRVVATTSGIAYTGADAGGMLAIAGILMASGIGLSAAARRRKA